MADNSITQLLREATPTISVGILTADQDKLNDEARLLEDNGVKLLHFDVMDGVFWPKQTVGADYVKGITTNLLKDVHLLVEEPGRLLDDFIGAGADVISLHMESKGDLLGLLKKIGAAENANDVSRGIARGVALNPGTSLDALAPLLGEVDLVTLVTVTPDSKTPDAATAERVAQARAMAKETGRNILLCIDGGIKKDNLAELARLGAEIMVSGSAVFDGVDAAGNAKFMLDAIAQVK